MKKRLQRVLLLLTLLSFILTPGTGAASQVYGHLYFSRLLLQTNAGHYLGLQDKTRNAFLLGALAPDSAWIAHMLTEPKVRASLSEKYEVKFPGKLRLHSSFIEDIHQDKPALFTLQLLQTANTETERAFALGWLSHYVVDSYIHDLINRHGGLVSDPNQYDSPAMKTHDRLEALEMRHVLQLHGNALREAAAAAGRAKVPLRLLQDAFAVTFPQNPYYSDFRQDFNLFMSISSRLIKDSTLWYGYQSDHSPAQIERMKRLLRRFQPQQGRLLEILPDLPPMQEYEKLKNSSPFLKDWAVRARKIEQKSQLLFDNSVAYFWWKDRQNSVADEIAAQSLNRIRVEMKRMNPADNLMQPRQR